MNKEQKTERQTQELENAECEKAVSLRHGLGYIQGLFQNVYQL
jgi:hypothetical protein